MERLSLKRIGFKLEKLEKLTIPLGKWFDVPVYLHWSWVLFMIYLFIANPVQAPLIFGAFVIVLLHEFGHCIAAQKFNWEIYDVYLYPIGGAASMDIKPHPFEEFIVAAAGPFVNVLLFFPLTYWRHIISILLYYGQ